MFEFLMFMALVVTFVILVALDPDPKLSRREEDQKLAKYLRENREEDLRIWRKSSRVPLP